MDKIVIVILPVVAAGIVIDIQSQSNGSSNNSNTVDGGDLAPPYIKISSQERKYSGDPKWCKISFIHHVGNI